MVRFLREARDFWWRQLRDFLVERPWQGDIEVFGARHLEVVFDQLIYATMPIVGYLYGKAVVRRIKYRWYLEKLEFLNKLRRLRR